MRDGLDLLDQGFKPEAPRSTLDPRRLEPLGRYGSCLHSAISTSWRSKTAENAATTPLRKFIDGRFSDSGLVDCCHNLLLAKDCLPGCRPPHTRGWLFCVDTVYLLHTVTAARIGLCLATPAHRTVGEEGSTRFVDVIDTC